MAVGWICATRLLGFSHVSRQIHYRRIEKSIWEPLEFFRSSKDVKNPLFSAKPEMRSRKQRNGSKVMPIRVMQQSGICLPTLGSSMSVFQSSLKTSVNLIAICIFVAWLQKTGQLPTDTSTVLSQVAFRLAIPCFLMTKVSKTIALQPEGNILIIPFIGIMQILAGIIIGKVAIRLMGKDTYGDLTNGDENLAKNNALIIAACAFGNTVTLPLVILSRILSTNDASMASAYVALFMVGWSPFLWSYGYHMFNTTYGQISSLDGDGKNSFLQMCTFWFHRIMNPPLYGILIGILIGTTPLAHIFFPEKGALPGLSGRIDGTLAVIYLGTSTLLQTIWEAASLLGSASVAVQTIVLACSFAPCIPFFNDKIKNSYDGELCEENGSNGESQNNSELVLDNQTFWAVTCIRLIAMPVAGLLLVKILHVAHLLPTNPVCIFTILVLSTMPSAQNLVVLIQLTAKSLAGVLADLLVLQYAISLVTIPLWITAYTALVHLM